MDSKLVLPFLPTVVGSFLNFQVVPLIQANKDDKMYFSGIIPLLLWFMNALSYVDLGLPLPHFKFLDDVHLLTCPNTRIYIETAVVVMISYVLLLVVKWSYIWLAVFPIIAIGFIVALCNELNGQNGSQQHDNGEASVGSGGDQEGGVEMQKAEGQEAAALVPYWVLCVMGQFHIADYFAISQFLLFFSFMLGALTQMMTRLALAGAAPGVAPASLLLRKALLVVLLVTVHTVTAELLGENVVLFILPELVPVLLWFSVHLDRDDGSVITADKIKSHGNVITVLGAAAAVFALLAVSMDEFLLSWCTKALVSCGVSGLLVYYVVFMLCQWPGLDGMPTSIVEDAVKLLKLWANILLITAAALLMFAFLAVFRLGQHEQMVAEPAPIFQRLCETLLKFII